MEEGKTGGRDTCSKSTGVRQGRDVGADVGDAAEVELLLIKRQMRVEGAAHLTSKEHSKQEFLLGDNGLRRSFQPESCVILWKTKGMATL